MSGVDTDGWHARPFISPAQNRDEAEAAARAYLKWESGRNRNIGAVQFERYEATEECGYEIRGGKIYIPRPKEQWKPGMRFWQFCPSKLTRPQQFLLDL